MIPVRTTSVTSAVSTEEPGLTTIWEGVGGGMGTITAAILERRGKVL